MPDFMAHSLWPVDISLQAERGKTAKTDAKMELHSTSVLFCAGKFTHAHVCRSKSHMSMILAMRSGFGDELRSIHVESGKAALSELQYEPDCKVFWRPEAVEQTMKTGFGRLSGHKSLYHPCPSSSVSCADAP